MKKLITMLLLFLTVCLVNAMDWCCSNLDDVHQPVSRSQRSQEGGSSGRSRNSRDSGSSNGKTSSSFHIYRLELRPITLRGDYLTVIRSVNSNGVNQRPYAGHGYVVDVVLMSSSALHCHVTLDMSDPNAGIINIPGTPTPEKLDHLTVRGHRVYELPSSEIAPMNEDAAREACMQKTGDDGWSRAFKQVNAVFNSDRLAQYYYYSISGIQFDLSGHFTISFSKLASRNVPHQVFAIVRISPGAS